jgi:hypothetical protein
MAVVHLAARLQPFQRGEFFEDPLDAELKSRGLGEVTGGGTLMTRDPEGIASCDIDVALRALDPQVLDSLIAILERLGAPKGSKLLVKGAPDRPLGQWEGMAVFLNGTDLAPETYARADVNATIKGLGAALGPAGELRGYHEGGAETALYFYGPDFARMEAAVRDFVAQDPLCQRCRIERIA